MVLRQLLVPIVIAFALCSNAAAGLADQWKVTLAKITVAPTKANGQPWDADGSLPDVFGEFGVGRLTGGRCVPASVESIAKHQNMAEFTSGISIVADATGIDTLCFGAKLMDKDLAADDPIGSGAAALLIGSHEYRFGQATLEVAVQGIDDSPSSPQEDATKDLPAPPAPRPVVYKISIVTARIHPARADGTTWDEPTDKDADDQRMLAGLLNIGLAVASGGTAIIQASAAVLKSSGSAQVSYKAQTASAPDPRVVVRWGGLTFATPKDRNTLQPRWDFTFLVPQEIAEHRPLRVDVLDADDGDDETIGTDSVSGKDVVNTDVFRRSFGGVDELVFEVEKVAEAESPIDKTMAIDTTHGWVDTGVDVVAGQTIRVTAHGQHCLQGRCMGPDGEDRIAFQHQKRGDGASAPIRVGQLAAVLGDDVVPIGFGASLIAKTCGRLWLGVASKASSGSLDAHVQIFYPLDNQ